VRYIISRLFGGNKVRRFVPVLLIVMLVSVSCAVIPTGAVQGPKVVLVSEGKAVSSIVIASKATRAAQFAAFELQWHIKQITGATLPIVTDNKKVEGARILVGESAATKAAGLAGDNFKEQEYLVRFMDDTVVLMGLDKQDTGAVTYDMNTFASYQTWPDRWDKRGTVNAVYDFLEKYCNVRWFNPTETGSDFPKTTTLVVRGVDICRAPAFAYRDAVYVGPGRYDDFTALWPKASEGFKAWEAAAYPELHKKFKHPHKYINAKRGRVRLFQLRMREGGRKVQCNHSMYGYYDRFWEKNPNAPQHFVEKKPDWFAKGYQNRPPQLCYTNKGLVKQLAQDARDYFDGKKTGKELHIFWQPNLPNPFPIEPQDNSSFCKCDKCQEWLKKKLGDVPFYSKGTHSEYFFQFVNEVAKEVKKTHPDGKLVTLAYMTHAYPPKSFKLESNVAVQFCFAANRSPQSGGYKHELDLLRKWAAEDKTRPLYLWLYYTFPKEIANAGKFNCFPGFFAHAIEEQFKVFHETGVQGMFHCGYGQEVEAYVTYKMMDDPTLDVDDLLDEYFSRLYGPAGDPLKKMYLTIEKIYSDPKNYPKGAGHQSMVIAWKHLGTAKRMANLAMLMEKAKRLTATDLQKKRVELFEKSVWSYMVAGRKQYVQRASTPIPTLGAPRVKPAGGDPAKVNWAKASVMGGPWYERGQAKNAIRKLSGRIAHDGEYLYIELTDPVDTKVLQSKGTVFPYDTWELFVAAQRGQPYRQYAVNPQALTRTLSHGEVNWRRNVVMEGLGLKAVTDVSAKNKWVTRLSIPLAKVVPGGVKPGGKIFLNVIRVSNPKIAPKGSRIGIDTWVSFCTVHEVDRLAEIRLEK